MVPSNNAALIIHGAHVTSNYYNRLIETYTEMNYMSYLCKRFGWKRDVIQDIAWKSLKLAIKKIERPVVMTKLLNRILAVNYIQKRRGYLETSKCKHCNNVEDVPHLFRCNLESRQKWRRSYIKELQKRLKEIKTDESYIDALTTILAEYMDTGKVTTSKYAGRFHIAIENQNCIGFQHFFFGKISQQWLNLFHNKRHGDSKEEPDPSNPKLYSWGGQVIEFTLKK